MADQITIELSDRDRFALYGYFAGSRSAGSDQARHVASAYSAFCLTELATIAERSDLREPDYPRDKVRDVTVQVPTARFVVQALTSDRPKLYPPPTSVAMRHDLMLLPLLDVLLAALAAK